MSSESKFKGTITIDGYEVGVHILPFCTADIQFFLTNRINQLTAVGYIDNTTLEIKWAYGKPEAHLEEIEKKVKQSFKLDDFDLAINMPFSSSDEYYEVMGKINPNLIEGYKKVTADYKKQWIIPAHGPPINKTGKEALDPMQYLYRTLEAYGIPFTEDLSGSIFINLEELPDKQIIISHGLDDTNNYCIGFYNCYEDGSMDEEPYAKVWFTREDLLARFLSLWRGSAFDWWQINDLPQWRRDIEDQYLEAQMQVNPQWVKEHYHNWWNLHMKKRMNALREQLLETILDKDIYARTFVEAGVNKLPWNELIKEASDYGIIENVEKELKKL